MIVTFFEFIKNLTAVIIVVPPAIFIFTVTLLGAAAEKSHAEEKIEMEKDEQATKEEIAKIDNQIKDQAKKGNLEELLKNLEFLKNHKKQSDNKIKTIKKKYNSINLSNALVYPFFCFMGAMYLAHIGVEILNKSNGSTWVVAFVAAIIILLFIGLLKTYRALLLVQEISVNKKEKEYFDHFKDAFKAALYEDRDDLKAEVGVRFADHSFPLNLNTDTEIKLPFRVKLNKGSVLSNLSVWFFVPDGLELIKPNEKDGWRQGPDYNPPNIRTVRVNIGKVSLGPYTPGILIIKSGKEKGKYTIKYRVYADGYVGSEEFIELIII